MVAEMMLSSAVPAKIPIAPVFETIIAVLLLGFLVTSIRFKTVSPDS